MNGQALSGTPVDPSTGIWVLGTGGAIIADPQGPATTPVTLLVPSQNLRILRVELPLASHAKRLAALPYAVEDQIADPLDAVHLALGARVAPKTYLVAVVRHRVMAQWVADAHGAGLGDAALVPDALALPMPDAGCWTVRAGADHTLVRASDGTGFGVPNTLFAAAWARGGRPALVNLGTSPVEGFAPAGTAWDRAAQLTPPALDLRQGQYARGGGSGGSWRRRIGWAIGIGVAAHLIIAIADLWALQGIARDRESAVRTAVQQVAPGTQLTGDLTAQLVPMLPTSTGASGKFLPQLNAISRALAPLGTGVRAQSIQFDQDVLSVDVAGNAQLAQQIQAALNASAVSVDVTAVDADTIRLRVRP